MSILSRLVLLVLAVLIPAMLASLVGMFHVYQERERSVERSLVEMSRALALVVDREIGRRENTLSLMSLAPSLVRDDLPTFGAYLRDAAHEAQAELILFDGQGQAVLGSAAFAATVIPPDSLMRGRRVASGAMISNTFVPASGEKSFAVVMPVIREGKQVYRLAMISPITQFQKVLTDLDLPAQWTGVVLDSDGVIVARNRDPADHVGSHANPDVLKHLSSGTQGVFHSTTRDGLPSLAAFNKAPGSGWTFLAALPESEINRSATDALKALALVAMILLAAALLLAARVGRSIVKPMRILTRQAESLGRGDLVEAGNTGLRETDVVSDSMGKASRLIRTANGTMERRVSEAVAASHRSQAALLQSQKLEALGRLTGGIAHDFNNLLQTLSTGLHIIGLLTDKPDAKGALDSCKRAVGRAAKLTRQLMAFGRNQVSEARRIDLRNQLLGMEDLLRGALRSDIALRLDLAEDLWPVHADPLQFELAVLNLAINARDATPGNGNVLISAENVVARPGEVAGLQVGDYVKLAFADDGEGMSAEVLEKALDPFFTTKAPGKGSGLGLAQVYGFVQQSHGVVTLSSKPGRGTAVSFYLPRSVAGDRTEPATDSTPGASCGGGASVLVVEDDVLVRDVIGPALAAHGFRVTLAADGDEALAMLDGTPPDIVFSDIVMPGSMNGVRLAEVLLERFPDLPVVLATGYSEAAGIPKDIKTITKPYEIGAVISALQEALNAKKQAASDDR